MSDKIIVSYHGDCPDGMGAAYAAHLALGLSATYVPVYHTKPFPFSQENLANAIVYCLDYCPKQPELEKMIHSAKQVIILDHHDGVKERTADLFQSGAITGEVSNLYSGAILAWRWFHPGKEPPALLKHIQDRDLWQWQLPASHQVLATLDSYPLNLETMDILVKKLAAAPQSFQAEGDSILRFRQQLIEATIALARPVNFLGYSVLAANAHPMLISEVGSFLAKDRPFSVCYYDLETGSRKFSLRATSDQVNLRKICEKLNGGGHARAAGFTLALNQLNMEGMPEI